ncbi:DUF4407 domain-containing protein [Nocardia callitridis]|uniref:DUF4407 domain-containing protein n=1 Tax=Nocardia callitridis TaxID=648753 RepID=A0ABP9JXJ8_9NOCA
MPVTGSLTWLGGGHADDVAYRHERTSYVVTGAAVLLFALVAGLFTAMAVGGSWPVRTTVVGAVLAAVLAALLGRAIATTRPDGGPDRLGLLARVSVAVLAGGLLAELAAIVVFGGSIDRVLEEKAQRAVDSAPAVVLARTELDTARTERAALGRSIDAAQADIDNALVTARCEYNPTPECPQTRITGVPGAGPEARTANELLDDARARLAAEQDRVAALDQRVADSENAVTTARSSSFASADRGLGARWRAMNDYTAQDSGALTLRVLVIVALIALALLPLLLRWWRGETSFDRQTAARGVLDQAEWEADTAIALERVHTRTEAENLRAAKQLTATKLEIEADNAIERERQRTRIIAAIGGIEIGVNEPTPTSARPSGPKTLSGTPTKDAHMPNDETPTHLPASVRSTEIVAPARADSGGGLELPLIGTVPFTDTAARFIRPLVPSFVANAIDTATHPLRTARHAFEEVEEITFTVRRTRKVTVDAQVLGDHAEHIATTVVDADYSDQNNR